MLELVICKILDLGIDLMDEVKKKSDWCAVIVGVFFLPIVLLCAIMFMHDDD